MVVLGTMIEGWLTLTKEASWWLVRLGSTFTIANRIDRSLVFRVYSVCRLVGWAEMEWVGVMGYSLLLAFHNKLRASWMFLKLQLTDLALSSPLVLWWKVPHGSITSTLVEHWIQAALLMRHISLLEDLTIKSCVCPCKVIHVSQCLIELCLIYFG